MKAYVAVVATILVLCSVRSAGAQDGQPLREARSENGRFILKIRPGSRERAPAGGCRAALFEREDGQQKETRRWERQLVNDVAPAVAVMRDDGRFVVTLDEFRRGGARHAVVIYGEKGQLLRHFLVTDLLERADWQQIKVRRGVVEWLRGAKYRFAREPEQFVIELKNGHSIRIDLKTLQVVRADRGAGRDASAGVPPEVLAALFSEELPAADALEQMAERSGIPREQLEKLRELGYLDVGATGAEAEIETVAGRTTEAPGLEGRDGKAAPESERAVDVGATKGPAGEEAVAGGRTADAAETATEPVAEQPTVWVDEHSTAGILVPLPNLHDPVDYLRWVNSMTVTDGPSAAPTYRAAIDNLVSFDGDAELLANALTGNAQALATPTVTAWLDANQKALEYFRRATMYDYRGFELESEDGSMLGALLPNLAPLRQLSKAAVIDGKRLEAAGRPADAVGSYLDTLAAGAHTGQGPTIIENLVGMAMQKLAADAILDLPAHSAGTSVDYTELAARLEDSYRSVRPLRETVQFERAMLLDTVQRIYEVDPETGAWRANRTWIVTTMTSDGTTVNINEAVDLDRAVRQVEALDVDQTVAEANAFYDGVTEVLSLPYSEGKRAMAELEAIATSEKSSLLLRQLAPSFSRVHFLSTRAETTRRATTLVTQIMAYKQQRGAYPESLAGLAEPVSAVDPFSERPFMYRQEGDGFVLYSVGDNGADDGGVHDAKGETNDLVFWPRIKEADQRR